MEVNYKKALLVGAICGLVGFICAWFLGVYGLLVSIPLAVYFGWNGDRFIK